MKIPPDDQLEQICRALNGGQDHGVERYGEMVTDVLRLAHIIAGWQAPDVPQPADKRLIAERTGENALAEWLEEVFSTGTEEGITWQAAAEALFEVRAVREAAGCCSPCRACR